VYFADGVFSDFLFCADGASRLLAGAGSEFALSTNLVASQPAAACRTHRVGVRRQGGAQCLGRGRAKFRGAAGDSLHGDDGMPIAALKLTPDGRTIVYARGSESNDAGETADPTATSKSEPSRCGPRTWIKAVASRASRACLAIWAATRGLRGHPDFSQR